MVGSSLLQNLNFQTRHAKGLPTTVAAAAGLNLVNIMIPFIESNDVLDDPPKLRKRLRDHGYLFIRGMLPRDEVRDLRRKFLEFCSEAG